ncbi:hypothetical protein JCM11641_008044 [Rhodosporidiobolus odoratus]
MTRTFPSLLLAAAAAASIAYVNAQHAGAHHVGVGSAHHAVRNAVYSARQQPGATAGGQGRSLLVERAAELALDADECDLEGGGCYAEDDEGQEWFGGNEYEAMRKLQERAEGWEGSTTQVLEERKIKNPKYIVNPKWALLGGGLSSASNSASTSSTSTKKQAATTEIIVGSPTPILTVDISIGLGLGGSSSSSTTSRPTSTSSSKSTSTTSPKTSSTTQYTLPTASSGCYQMYTKTSGGAVYGPQMASGAPAKAFMPKPSTFVTRKKNKLYLDGSEFRITGPNIYWLGLDENVNSQVSYPGKPRIREAMAMTVAMGGNTIRSHSLGVSMTLWPKAWQTNEAAWDTIDYSIYAAREYGLRLIIPLTDNYAYYHGGKYDFIGWGGGDTSDASEFYENDNVVNIFKGYIAMLLNHTNTYTGVKLKDDPTILAWETGNELGGYMLGGGAPPAYWTQDIASYIKSLAPSHLVADGTDGLTDYSGSLANTGISVDEVDLVTDHFYPALQWLLAKDQGWMNSHTDKVFFVGENDWTGQKGGSDLDTFYSYIKDSMPGSGSMMWSMFGRDDQCCDWIKHNDGYSLYYPNGMTSTVESYAGKLMAHWYAMRGLTAPSVLPAVACPQQELS